MNSEQISKADKAVPDDRRVNVDFVQNTGSYSVGFDYDAIDEALEGEGPIKHIVDDQAKYLSATKSLLQWIRNGTNARAKEIRLQAAFFFADGEQKKNQVRLAREIGVGKATISKKAVELKDYFKIKLPGGAAAQMRSNEARETFSKVCKSNHQKRKALSKSADSQKRSTANTKKQSDLRARVLNLATQQS